MPTVADTQKGGTVPVAFMFMKLKEMMMKVLSLQVVNPYWPFVLRTDASGFAIRAVLEQVPKVVGMPTVADTQSGGTVPVAFMSRKLTESQNRTWSTRDKEAYAVVFALEKWASWIGQ